MKFEDLTPEQQEKAKGIKTLEEAMAFIKEESIDLSEEELDQLAGGKASPGGKEHHYIWE
ncbi:MAG: hypothetical protein IJ087_19445 [Eggerthellaceae bacterium]|nr:hypothetical protein [Eggerthellaceae bacterium]